MKKEVCIRGGNEPSRMAQVREFHHCLSSRQIPDRSVAGGAGCLSSKPPNAPIEQGRASLNHATRVEKRVIPGNQEWTSPDRDIDIPRGHVHESNGVAGLVGVVRLRGCGPALDPVIWIPNEIGKGRAGARRSREETLYFFGRYRCVAIP